MRAKASEAALRRAALIVALILGLPGAAVRAEPVDALRVYELKCARCHGTDAGHFARQGLRRADGQIVGAENGLELQPFLARGHGRLASDEVEPMVAALKQLFEAKATE